MGGNPVHRGLRDPAAHHDRLAADDYRGRYEARQYADADGAKLLYRLLKPKDYDPQTKYPLVLFLHGGGRTGQRQPGSWCMA